MKADRLEREHELFDATLALAPADRSAFLAEACGGDHEFIARVERLIRWAERDTADDLVPGADDPGRREPDTLDDQPGTSFGPYRIVELIGEGGFGAVYRAEQERPIRRTVALKIIKLGMDTKQVIARFDAERQALAMMDHPHIARVFDAGATDTGRPYFAMELVEGIPITAYCDQKTLDLEKRLELFVLVCEAVQHAHQKGIIHRDLKPSNVLVFGDETPVPKVIDFGIAKATSLRLTEMTLATESGQLVGTPAYMSPEQADSRGEDIDTRSDIYSLGVLLYELLTASTPFDSTSLESVPYAEIQRVIREQEPPTPSTRLRHLGLALTDVARARRTDPEKLGRQLRGDLDWIVMKALEKDRERRYQTAAEMVADVRRFLTHDVVLARPPGTAYRLQKFVRRHRLGVTAGALITAALLAGAALAAVGFARATRDRDLATERLWNSYLAQARAGRFSNLPGRRFDGVEALRLAAAIRPSLELRNEAIACLTLADVKIEYRFDEASAVASATGLREIDRFARGTDDGGITVISIDDGRELRRLEGPSLRVSSLLFSPDGRCLAAKYHTGDNIRLWVWDLAAAEPVLQLDGDQYRRGGIAFGADGNWVAIGQTDGRVHVHDLPLGSLRRSLPPGSVDTLSWFSAHPREPKLAVSNSVDGQVKVWDLDAGVVVTTMSAPSPVYHTAWSGDGRLLAGGCEDQNAYIWDGETGRLKNTLSGHQGQVIDVSFNTSGDLLASYGWDNTTRLWDVRTGLQILDPITNWELRGFAGRLATMRFRAGAFAVWRLEPGREHRRLHAASKLGVALEIGIGPQGRFLAAAGSTGIHLWDLARGAEPSVLTEDPVTNLLMFPDGGGLGVIAGGQLVRWPLQIDGDIVRVGDPEVLWSKEPLVNACLSSDGDIAVLGTRARVVVFDLAEERERLTFPGFRGRGRASISHDSRWLFNGAWKSETAAIRDLRSGQTVREFPGELVYGAFSPDGLLLAVNDEEALRFYRSGTWTVHREIPHPRHARPTQPVFSPDGTVVAVQNAKFEVQLVAVETGEPVANLWSPDPYLIDQLCFSPDGGTLAAASPDRVIQIWDLRLIRRGLRDLGLDWDQPSYGPGTVEPAPLRVVFTTDDAAVVPE